MNFEESNIHHQNLTEKDISKLKKLFEEVIRLSVMYLSFEAIKGDLFEFSKYISLQKRINNLFEEFNKKTVESIDLYVDKHWRLSTNKKIFYEGKEVAHNSLKKELDFFKNRPNRLLSERVWNLSSQFRQELEMSIDLAISDGIPANQLATEIKKYLKEPDKLFRKYRDKNGQLQLSKKAEAYKPGQGIYRSSYKNAERLVRTEINMAYREADIERWQSLNFVVGYEIKRSKHPHACTICDMMEGKYPKSFKWWGNHPNCRCYLVPIFKENVKGEVKMNPKFTQWLSDNEDYILTAKSKPMFLWGMEVQKQSLNISQIKEAVNNKSITENIFKSKIGWAKERTILHDKIIKDYFNQEKVSADKVYMLGGAPANGKSSVTESGLLPHPKKGLVIDADKVKSMIPEYQKMLASGDKDLIKAAANFVHEESSYLGKRIREKALLENWGTIIDGVNDGSATKIHENAQLIKKLSGKKVRADYVSLDTDLSIKLAQIRSEKTGREVPLEFIKKQNKAISKEFPDILKNQSFDELYLWDTNINGKPRLILKQIDGELEIIDEELYKKFLAKAN